MRVETSFVHVQTSLLCNTLGTGISLQYFSEVSCHTFHLSLFETVLQHIKTKVSYIIYHNYNYGLHRM